MVLHVHSVQQHLLADAWHHFSTAVAVLGLSILMATVVTAAFAMCLKHGVG
jgi:hypothetical protein